MSAKKNLNFSNRKTGKTYGRRFKVGIHQHEPGLADVGLDAEQRSTHLRRLQIYFKKHFNLKP
jgi:hypothetical protein